MWYNQIMRKNNRRIIFEIILPCFSVIAGIFIYFALPKILIKTPLAPDEVSPFYPSYEGKIWRKIDGLPASPGNGNSPIYAVVVENHVDSRPLSGLSRASLVFEAPVEGGITRFLAIFSGDAEINEIGPVRSARPYFIDWADEFGGLLAHVGGSDAALEQIKNGSAPVDLNQYYKSEYFWRDEARFAPHNVYTKSELLGSAANNLKISPPTYDGWKFKEDAPLWARPEKTEIEISSPLKAYAVKWIYDRAHNNYVRYVGGKIQKDKNGPAVRAKNVVALKTDIEIIDVVTRRAIQTVGEGEATVFRDGEAIPARWKKADAKARLKFYDADGGEIIFNAGPTWIEIVSN